jgi:hypothetical protein
MNELVTSLTLPCGLTMTGLTPVTILLGEHVGEFADHPQVCELGHGEQDFDRCPGRLHFAWRPWPWQHYTAYRASAEVMLPWAKSGAQLFVGVQSLEFLEVLTEVFDDHRDLISFHRIETTRAGGWVDKSFGLQVLLNAGNMGLEVR